MDELKEENAKLKSEIKDLQAVIEEVKTDPKSHTAKLAQ